MGFKQTKPALETWAESFADIASGFRGTVSLSQYAAIFQSVESLAL
jgi:hypothetical protein